MALYLTEADIAKLLPMKDALSSVEGVFQRWGQDKAVNHVRRHIRVPAGSLQVMDAADMEQRTGFKSYLASGRGTQRYVYLFDSKTGALLALMEVNLLGEIRTGAASEIATKYMARENATTVCIIGTGKQAEQQIAAVCAVRPIKHVKVFSCTAERRAEFSVKMDKMLNVAMQLMETAKECTEGVDIVITITSSAPPILEGAWLAPGTHVNAAGNASSQRREIDEVVITKSEVIACDEIAVAKTECGELIWAADRGTFRWEQASEIRDIVASRMKDRLTQQSTTLYESHGVALEDLAASWVIYHKAVEQGMGTPLPMFT